MQKNSKKKFSKIFQNLTLQIFQMENWKIFILGTKLAQNVEIFSIFYKKKYINKNINNK